MAECQSQFGFGGRYHLLTDADLYVLNPVELGWSFVQPIDRHTGDWVKPSKHCYQFESSAAEAVVFNHGDHGVRLRQDSNWGLVDMKSPDKDYGYSETDRLRRHNVSRGSDTEINQYTVEQPILYYE